MVFQLKVCRSNCKWKKYLFYLENSQINEILVYILQIHFDFYTVNGGADLDLGYLDPGTQAWWSPLPQH